MAGRGAAFRGDDARGAALRGAALRPAPTATAAAGPRRPRCRPHCRRVRRSADGVPGSRRTPDEHSDGEHGEALAAPERAELFGAAPLTLTGAPTAAASRASISSRMGASLGCSQMTEQSALPIDHPASTHLDGDLAQQLDRIGPRQRRIGVREVLADVAEPGRPEQGVGDGVGDGVAVAVPDEAGQPGERAAAEDQRP